MKIRKDSTLASHNQYSTFLVKPVFFDLQNPIYNKCLQEINEYRLDLLSEKCPLNE